MDDALEIMSDPTEDTALPGLRTALEAVLLVVEEPVDEVTLAQVLERPRDEIGQVLRDLAAEYERDDRGFDLRAVAGGWRLYTRASCAPYVERFAREGQSAKLSQAETSFGRQAPPYGPWPWVP